MCLRCSDTSERARTGGDSPAEHFTLYQARTVCDWAPAKASFLSSTHTLHRSRAPLRMRPCTLAPSDSRLPCASVRVGKHSRNIKAKLLKAYSC